jgi:hypothetical protein
MVIVLGFEGLVMVRNYGDRLGLQRFLDLLLFEALCSWLSRSF